MLEVFWDSHYPTFSRSRQYMSIVFYHNELQREQALASKEQQAQILGETVLTEIIPYSVFYPAEDYHQKYYLSLDRDWQKELRSIYPDIQDFISSTAVARINGYIGGYGDTETMERELDSYGLTEAGKTELLKLADRGLSAGCPVP